MIHPHIQWGNENRPTTSPEWGDTPSHTVREPLNEIEVRLQSRYTLTYSEGTVCSDNWKGRPAIHPHIQWGNCSNENVSGNPLDTPSHTVREPNDTGSPKPTTRYTLTYSEGTFPISLGMFFLPIHPHIQWGNTQYLRGFQPLQIPRCAICTKAFCHSRHIFNMPKNLIC